MTTVLIVVHLMVVLAMIGLVLLQRSEGGALGIGGGSGAFMTGRSAANVLTRATGFLAIAFFATSLGLALLARLADTPADILEVPGATVPVDTGEPQTPVAGGAPESAEDVLEALGGAGGPQEAPAADTDTEVPATDSTAPADGEAPAVDGAAPANEGTAPAAEPPPAAPTP